MNGRIDRKKKRELETDHRLAKSAIDLLREHFGAGDANLEVYEFQGEPMVNLSFASADMSAIEKFFDGVRKASPRDTTATRRKAGDLTPIHMVPS